MTKREYNKQYRSANLSKLRAYSSVYSASNRKAIAEKALAYYYANRKEILFKKRAYTQQTKVHKRQYNQAYRAANLEILKAKAKERNARTLEQRRISQRAYWEKNKSKCAAWRKAYRQRHPDRKTALENKRRAMERNAPTDVTGSARFYAWIKNQDFVTCTYCGTYISGSAVHIDHIVPISRGGHHAPDNFCVSCGPCNSSKHDQLLSEWKRCPERIRNLISFVETSGN